MTEREIQQATLFAYLATFRRLGFLCLFSLCSSSCSGAAPPRGPVAVE